MKSASKTVATSRPEPTSIEKLARRIAHFETRVGQIVEDYTGAQAHFFTEIKKYGFVSDAITHLSERLIRAETLFRIYQPLIEVMGGGDYQDATDCAKVPLLRERLHHMHKVVVPEFMRLTQSSCWMTNTVSQFKVSTAVQEMNGFNGSLATANEIMLDMEALVCTINSQAV